MNRIYASVAAAIALAVYAPEHAQAQTPVTVSSWGTPITLVGAGKPGGPVVLDGNGQIPVENIKDALAQYASETLPFGTYVDENGIVKVIPKNAGTLPPDVTLNGGIYMAGSTALPSGLSSNGGVIMTDGSVFYPGTFSLGGVLAANPNAIGA